MQRLIGMVAAGVLVVMAACEERVVSPALVDTVFIEPDAATMEVGRTRRFEAVFVDADGNELRGRSVQWSTENPAVAEVDGAGEVRGLTPGETRLNAVVEGRQGHATITIVRRSVSTVRIEPQNPSVLLGRSMTLRAVPLDDEGGELNDRSVTWSSRNTTIVPVTSEGVVRGQRLGSTVVEAVIEGKQGETTVTVNAPELSAMEVRPGSATLEVDDTLRLQAVGRTDGGDEVHDLPVAWSSTNSDVVSVDEGGRVQAVAPGEVRVRASFGGRTGEAAITVRVPSAASVRVEPSSASIVAGTSARLAATARDARGRVVEKDFAWSTNNGSIATVDGTGLVTGVAPGTTFIVARTDAVRDSAAIIVTPRPVASVEIEPQDPSIRVLGEIQLTAILRAANGEELTGRTVQWSSSNSAVASVSSSGLVRGLLVGEATITAQSEGQSGTTRVRVTALPPARISVAPSAPEILVGGTVPLTATVFDENDNVLDLPVTWSSTAGGIATVNDQGLVTGVAPGEATIRASAGAVSGEARVRVAEVPVARIEVSPTNREIDVDETLQMEARAYDANNNLLNRPITWASSNSGIAWITTTGEVRGVNPGMATITASYGGVQGSTTVTVREPPPAPARIEVNPSSVVLEEGSSIQLTATVFNNAGQIVNTGIDWSTSDDRIARVTGNGRVTARREGTATIFARALGLVGTAAIRVVDDDDDADDI